MNYLELCRRARRECGIAGAETDPTAVTSQVGEYRRLVDWVSEAWTEIQGRHTDWRWLPPREDSPWYPTLRLFRQEAFGDWTPVVRRAAAALHDLSGRPLAAALSSCKESP